MMLSILLSLLLLFAPLARAALPDSLTLAEALKRAGAAHPTLAEARARADQDAAGVALAEAEDDAWLAADARLRLIDPARDAADQRNDDSGIGLLVEKRLYDFGRTRNAIEGARHAAESSALALRDARRKRYLAVLRGYFDVILADLTFARDNEAMSIQFVRLDKRRNAHELGRVSDLVLAQAEDDYQRIRAVRAASELRQRLARQRLANLLDRPDDLPSELEEPELTIAARKPPEFEPLLERAMRDNPRLLALRARVDAARADVTRARKENGPVLSARLQARAWRRDSASRNPLSAELRLELPLYTGGRRDAEVAAARAALELARARLAAYQLWLRERLLDRLLAISRLRVELERQRVLAERRDLELDRSRALYDLEVNSDLGDAMTKVSAARLEETRAEYELALAWVELHLLTGEELNEQTILELLAGPAG